MNHVEKIIIHCTATPEGREVTVDEIRKWHKDRGFWDIGYHYVVQLDGTISRGRDTQFSGAHCKGMNNNSIGIAYVGGVDNKMKPKDTRTDAQKHALKILVEKYNDEFHGITIHGHNEFSKKECPSFDVQEWIKEIGL